MQVEKIPIAKVATLYRCERTGMEYILMINKALYMGDKARGTLLNPNQLRANGVTVSDAPKQFDKNSTHSITANTEASDMVVISLSLLGVISGFAATNQPRKKWRTYPTSYSLQARSGIPTTKVSQKGNGKWHQWKLSESHRRITSTLTHVG